MNQHAICYCGRGAFEPHYKVLPDGTRKSIGLDPAILANPRVKEISDVYELMDGAILFSAKGTDERHLMLTEDGHRLLITGCAHEGILDIVSVARERHHFNPTAIIGGFHLRGLLCRFWEVS